MSAVRSRLHRLGPASVELRGQGALDDLFATHLGPASATTEAGEPAVVVEEVERVQGVAPAGSRRYSSRRGAAVVTDGTPVTVRWERRARSMQPLIAAAHLAARARGDVLLHGAAFAWDGPATVVTGPSGAGKTGVLLAAVDAGAALLAADWSWLAVDDAILHPLPQPVRLRPHHLRAAAAGRALGRTERTMLRLAGRLPTAVASRAHLDVPRSRFGVVAARRARDEVALERVFVLNADGPSADATEDMDDGLAVWTADALAGTDSRRVLAALEDVVPIRRASSAEVAEAIAQARVEP